MTNLIDMTAAQLAQYFNELTNKNLKATSYPKKKWIAMIEAEEAEIEDDAPVVGEYTNCPNCGTHLNNGYDDHFASIADGNAGNKEKQYTCLGCGEEFGPDLEQENDEEGDDITLAEICQELGVKPRAARVKLRASEKYDDKAYTRYIWPRGNKAILKQVKEIIAPQS